jgi:PAS domain S-box-containing protein
MMQDTRSLEQTKEDLEIKNRQLQERIKELNCLYQLSKLFEDRISSEPELLQKVVELLPPSWQYPEITCARLVWQGREYTTPHFQDTEWRQSSPIRMNQHIMGFLEVCYVEKRPQSYEGPFLKEERNLIDTLAQNLGRYLKTRQLEQEKHRSEEFSRAIVHSSPLAIYSLDLKGNVLTWNTAAERILGWSAAEVIGSSLPIVPQGKEEEFAAIRQRIAIEGGFTGLELVRKRKDGRLIDISLSTAPIYNEQGQVYGIMAALEDITDRKKTERIVTETAENLRVTLNSIGDGVIATDTRGRITRMNPVAETLTGWSFEEAAGQFLDRVFHIVNAQTGERVENPVHKVQATGMIVGMANHTKLIARGGAEYQISDSGAPITDKEGNTLGVVLVFRDVTHEYLLHEELQASETRFRELFDNMNSGVAVYQAVDEGKDFVFLDLNKAGEKIDNIEAGSVSGQRVTQVFPNVQEFGLLDVMQRVWRTGVPEQLPVSEYKDERIAGWRENFIYKLPSGEVVAVYDDVTRRKQVEMELLHSEKKYRTLFETMAQGVVYQDPEGAIISANPAAERILGLSQDQMQGRTSMDPQWKAVDEDKNELPGERHPAMVALQTGKPVVDFVQGIFNPQINEYVWIIVNSMPQFAEHTNEILQVYSTFLDITERKRAEESLKQSEARYRELFNSIRDAILVSDAERNIIDCNTAFTDLFGYSQQELRGRKTSAVYNDLSEYKKMGLELTENIKNPQFIYTINYKTKEGRVFPGETNVFYLKKNSGEITGFIGLIRDVSEREEVQAERDRLEMQLRQAQKMEAIGRLAGGVAHDFNNFLTTISGNAQLGLMDLEKGQELYEIMQEIKEAGERAGNLTRQLLAFSRKQILQPEILDLNDVILDLEKMLRRLIGEDISLVVQTAADLGLVEADPGQMEQVIMNLAINARDAMPEGGKVTIEVANVQLDESYSRQHAHLITPGPYVMLAVSDTGIGMGPEIQNLVFDPFFTTKAKDKGTGLGLSTVYGIVKQSRGDIWVYSEPGKGTTFKIYLPRTEETVPGQRPEPDREPCPLGSETVLVVEDDESVRKIAVRNLIRFGYTVLSAASADEAYQLCLERRGEIDLLLTDVVMLGMSGKELVDSLQKEKVDMKVVYMSGYTDNAIVHHGVLDPGICFLQKPFSPESLASKIREALDRDEK